METVVVDFLGASNQQLELLSSSIFDFGYDLHKRTNVTDQGEASTNLLQHGDQTKASKLDRKY